MKHDNMTLNSEININILIGQSEDYPNNKYERGKASLIIGMIFIKKKLYSGFDSVHLANCRHITVFLGDCHS